MWSTIFDKKSARSCAHKRSPDNESCSDSHPTVFICLLIKMHHTAITCNSLPSRSVLHTFSRIIRELKIWLCASRLSQYNYKKLSYRLLVVLKMSLDSDMKYCSIILCLHVLEKNCLISLRCSLFYEKRYQCVMKFPHTQSVFARFKRHMRPSARSNPSSLSQGGAAQPSHG